MIGGGLKWFKCIFAIGWKNGGNAWLNERKQPWLTRMAAACSATHFESLTLGCVGARRGHGPAFQSLKVPFSGIDALLSRVNERYGDDSDFQSIKTLPAAKTASPTSAAAALCFPSKLSTDLLLCMISNAFSLC